MIVQFDSLQDAVIYAVEHGLPWWVVKPIPYDDYRCDGFYIEVEEDGNDTK